MALIDGLISYWKLDEASGTRNDSHSTNHLTDNATVGSGTGKVNNAADFIAANGEFLSLADNADVSFADDALTFNLWGRPDDTGVTRTLFGKWSAAGDAPTLEYALRRLSGNVFDWRVGNGSGTNTNKSHSQAVSSATWYMVTVMHDPAANVIGISVNGGAFETAAFSGGLLDSTNSFCVGRPGDFAGQYWDGLIDEMGVWGRVWTTDDLTEAYGGGTPPAYPFGAAARLRLPAVGATQAVLQASNY